LLVCRQLSSSASGVFKKRFNVLGERPVICDCKELLSAPLACFDATAFQLLALSFATLRLPTLLFNRRFILRLLDLGDDSRRTSFECVSDGLELLRQRPRCCLPPVLFPTLPIRKNSRLAAPNAHWACAPDELAGEERAQHRSDVREM
jgi:hypothetical protein